MTAPFRIVVLISGRGSNLGAIIKQVEAGSLPVQICAVISNRTGAEGLKAAEAAKIPVIVIENSKYSGREQFEQELIKAIDQFSPELVVLAGFMRVLTPAFVLHYENRMINIHPSLLPKFPGLDTHARAIAANEMEHGATVHFVTPEVDAGPVICQARVAILPDDTPATLADRVLEKEHEIYPQAIKWIAENRISVKNGKVLLDQSTDPMAQTP